MEGAASGASFGGIGVSNQPHQQLANRTAYLKNRQDTNIASIATLNAFKALFASTINVNGNNIFKFGVLDSARGQIDLIVQYGYFNIGSVPVAGDTEYSVSYGMQFPNAVLGPPLLTNIYVSTSGRNTAASLLSTAGRPLASPWCSTFRRRDRQLQRKRAHRRRQLFSFRLLRGEGMKRGLSSFFAVLLVTLFATVASAQYSPIPDYSGPNAGRSFRSAINEAFGGQWHFAYHRFASVGESAFPDDGSGLRVR